MTWRTIGRPSRIARSLSPPKREPAPAAQHDRPDVIGRPPSRPPPPPRRPSRGPDDAACRCPPYRSATTSAMIASAVSDGFRPPRSSPTGPRSRASSASVDAGLAQPLPAIGLRLPRPDRADVAAAAARAPRRSPARRTSRRGSAPRPRRPARARSRRRPRPASRRPAGRHGPGKPLGGRERRAARRRRRSRSRAPSRRPRATERPRPRRRSRAAGGPGTPRRTPGDRRSRPSARCRGASASAAAAASAASAAGVPRVPSSRPSAWTTIGVGGRRPVARLVRGRTPRGGASAGRTVATARLPRSRARGDVPRRRHAGLDEHVDRAAAGEADVPRLLVADPVADHPAVPVLARPLDLLGRGALDAAAADRSPRSARRRPSEDRALGPRRAAERPHDHGPADAGALRAPAVERVEELLHGCVLQPSFGVVSGEGPRVGPARDRRPGAAAGAAWRPGANRPMTARPSWRG